MYRDVSSSSVQVRCCCCCWSRASFSSVNDSCAASRVSLAFIAVRSSITAAIDVIMRLRLRNLIWRCWRSHLENLLFHRWSIGIRKAADFCLLHLILGIVQLVQRMRALAATIVIVVGYPTPKIIRHCLRARSPLWRMRPQLHRLFHCSPHRRIALGAVPRFKYKIILNISSEERVIPFPAFVWCVRETECFLWRLLSFVW